MEHQANTYRGIKLADSVRLYNKNSKRYGLYNEKVKAGLDNFINLLEENGHEVLSEYVKATDKVLIDFKCDHPDHWISPNKYLGGKGCPKCSGVCSKQAEEDLLTKIKENNHELLSVYKGNKEKVLINFKCGHKPNWITPNSYKSGNHCPKCGGIRAAAPKKRAAEQSLLNMIQANDHELLSDYINDKEKVLIDFNCGHKAHWISPTHYKQGQGCQECGTIRAAEKKSQPVRDAFISLVESNGHVLLSEYTHIHDKVLIDFNCGHKPHSLVANSYKHGVRCPHCQESKGERIIREWLEENNVIYIAQYRFPNDKRKYDFMLPFENTVVEIHGLQHYEEIPHYHKEAPGGKSFKQEQKNDKLKQEFAESLGYNYIVVDYREHKPQLALERFIAAFIELESQKNSHLI
ncbi:hypothetical protein PDJ82_07405 [Bacillus cereus group sp. TH43LC]|uniref:hypothetical protein n=1 Tax=Bacillus cereus group TaxID=86661 RepID=UPI0021511317|nr:MULTISPECIES: hypothetical protein [Bacillus cereus group]MCR6462292.1 hypothetical protein [Bacillus paranthracis]MCR9022722.1 hypothetical protein [Bacillus paranthracis]MDA1501421.1 hypothetical protein [Bacillus cereus group sp. TH43LC]